MDKKDIINAVFSKNIHTTEYKLNNLLDKLIESELIKYQEWLNDSELDETAELYNEAMVYSYINNKIIQL